MFKLAAFDTNLNLLDGVSHKELNSLTHSLRIVLPNCCLKGAKRQALQFFLPELISAKSILARLLPESDCTPRGFRLLPLRQLPRSEQGQNTDDRVAVFWRSGGTRVWTELFVLARDFGPSGSPFRPTEDLQCNSSCRCVTQMSHCCGLGEKTFEFEPAELWMPKLFRTN